MKAIRSVLLIVLLMVWGPVFALVCSQWSSTGGVWYPTIQEAANASVGKPANCSWSNPYALYKKRVLSVNEATDGWSWMYGYCGNEADVNVGSGNLVRRTGNYCPDPPKCPVGVKTTQNITRGYSGRPVASGGIAPIDFLPSGAVNTGGVPALPPTICLRGCIQTTGDVIDIFMNRAANEQGLYRVSTDVDFTQTASECAATTAEAQMGDTTLAIPACQGSLGYIGDKKVCIPKIPNSTGSGSGQGVSGSKNGGIVDGNPGAGTGSEAPAGTRFPPAGDGGNTGGPATGSTGIRTLPDGSAITGTPTVPATGTKSAVAGEEQVSCGAPGQAPCKIDETGTPGPVPADGNLGGSGTISDKVKTDADAAILQHRQLQSPPWSWSFQLPTGCSPLVLPAFNMTLDVCQWQPMMHDIMSMIWAMVGVFAGLGMFMRSQRG